MSIINLYNDLNNQIIEYLNDKDSCSYIKTCKSINKKNNGYIKNFIYDVDNQNLIDYVIKYLKHEKTIQYMKISNLDNPHIWFNGRLPKTIVYDRCSITEIIDPIHNMKTEYITIYDPHKKTQKTSINLNKFLKLKKFILK
jgi:hypothetical protein